MSKFTCKYCGMSLPIYKQVGPHIGEWCHMCQRWIRWVPKREINAEANTVEKTVTQRIVDAQLLKDEARQQYEELLEDELPWD